MCLCKQPFTQVSRGATEREHTFIPFLMVMTQKSRLAFLHFSRHYWSGSLAFFCFSLNKTPTFTLPPFPLVTPLVTLQGKYQHLKLSYYWTFLPACCVLLLEWKHLKIHLFCSLPYFHTWRSVLYCVGLPSQ